MTRTQALRAGLSASAIGRLVTDGTWQSLLPGVYALEGTPRSPEQRLRAALLWAGPGAILSHRSAACLWQMEPISEPRLVEITTPRCLRSIDVVVHRGRFEHREITRLGTIPLTDPARTLLDLGAVVAPEVVRSALDDALRRRLTTQAKLRRRLRDLSDHGRNGWGVLRELLEEPIAESVLERRLLRIFSRAGIPLPVTQHAVRIGGRLLARVDFAYPERRIAIEADGWRYHTGPDAFGRDLARRNRLTLAGWTVLHATWGDLRNPATLLESIRGALASRAEPSDRTG